MMRGNGGEGGGGGSGGPTHVIGHILNCLRGANVLLAWIGLCMREREREGEGDGIGAI